MSRRRQSGFDDVMEILMIAPWWFGPILALIVYLAFRFLPVIFISSAPAVSQGPNPSFNFGAVLRPLLINISPIAGVFVLFMWVLSLIGRLFRGRRLDRQTGIQSIRQLDWREFEQLLTEVFHRQGYVSEHIGDPAGDGGVDIRLTRDGKTTLVQCKHWKAWKVDVKVVRELLGVMSSERADYGVVVTSGQFTGEAEDFARKNGIHLIAADEFEKMIASVQRGGGGPGVGSASPARAAASFSAAGSTPNAGGNTATPACPRCGSPMVRKTAGHGVYRGQDFWSCSEFPDCRGKIQIG